jgi:hypothetical protein
MVMGNLNNVIFFIVLAVLVRNFSKNMIIVLGTPLILVNLFAMRNGIFEGMENKSDTTTTDTTTTPPTTSATITSDTTTGTKDKKDESGVVSAASVKNDSFEVGRSKNGGSKIDYASTIEDAYDDLNKILGSDGIKRLTDDTQGLMKQQMELAKSMEALTPLFKGMKPMIEQMKGIMNTMNK